MHKARSWLLLILTLPTENATARMRFWRALKAMGCAVLRDGVYLLPQAPQHREALQELADAIVEAGGTAMLIDTSSRDETQDMLFLGLFDRSEAYTEFGQSLSTVRKSLSGLSAPEVNRLLRRLRREYDALRAIDYFPGEATVRAEATWSDFVGVVDMLLSPDEPHAAHGSIARRNIGDYQARTWATRRGLWVDRVASAWLIQRFIDTQARFLWLEKPSACPKKALGFDFDGAAFTHVGERVTFEVLLASFGLDDDRGLLRLGQMVHVLDVGGAPVPEAGGFEAFLGGARERGLNDDQLLEQAGYVLDSLYAHFGKSDTQQKRS
ncbi:chromate resistance protein ChrB domain-containing protein [Dyella sp. 2RAF44]|jgi:hypothetical protein|uniref:chromate resistance protein ChrB domain-containing protein n=1 Tax=Dyella sp. 2RAF44 TaxID=3233000 RepID=UPI003F936B63